MQNQGPNQDHTPECPQCQIKEALIAQYLQLITLQKGKRAKCQKQQTINSLSLKQSFDQANTKITHSEIPFNKCQLLFTLTSIFNNKVRCYFRDILTKDKNKLFFLILNRIIITKIEKVGFQTIRNYKTRYLLPATCSENQSQVQSQGTIGNNAFNKFRILSILNKTQPIPSQPSIKQKYSDNINIQLKMQQQKSKYQQIITQLKQQLQQSYRKQNKQNQRKKASLQMLAQDINQKNSIIKQLSQKIQFIQSREGIFSANTLQKQIQQLLTVKINLQNNIQKLKQTNTTLNQTNQVLKEQIISLKQTLSKIKSQKYVLAIQLQQIKAINIKRQPIVTYLQNSLQNIIKREARIQQDTKRINKTRTSLINASNKDQQMQRKIQQTQQQQKDQVSLLKDQINRLQTQILCLLSHVFKNQDNLVSLKDKNIFSSQQIRVLNQKIYKQDLKQDDQSNILNKDKKHNKDNIQTMKIIKENTKEGQRQCQLQPQHLQLSKLPYRSTSRDGQANLTIQLLQMEIQRNNKIQKIAELKNKFMHVRQIVFQFLKSIQLPTDFNSGCKGILQVIMNIFQYSEEEKFQIFSHKKWKMFGII